MSTAMQLGVFESVNGHEPKSSPGHGVTCAVWVDGVRPTRRSGLAATSGVLGFRVRTYTSFTSQPYDAIDPALTFAILELMGAFSSDFDFGALSAAEGGFGPGIRGIDLLGGEGSGEQLSARAGYLEIDKRMFRIMTINLPIIINDLWNQAG